MGGEAPVFRRDTGLVFERKRTVAVLGERKQAIESAVLPLLLETSELNCRPPKAATPRSSLFDSDESERKSYRNMPSVKGASYVPGEYSHTGGIR
jgi:hypothetical protein